jgi:hypothetical protein
LLTSGFLVASRVFTIVAIRGKTLAVALRTVGASWLTAAAPVVAVIAAITAVAGAFLFVSKNAEAFQARFTNIFIKIKTRVLEQINRLIDGLNPLLGAVGLEIERAKIEPQDLVDEPKFQSFSEFIGSIKDDLVDLVPGLGSAAEGFGKLKEAVFGGGDSAGTGDLGIDGAFNNFTGLPGQETGGSGTATIASGLKTATEQAVVFDNTVKGITSSVQGLTAGLTGVVEQTTALSSGVTSIGQNESFATIGAGVSGIVSGFQQVAQGAANVQVAFSERFPVLSEQIASLANGIQQGLTQSFEGLFTTIVEGGKNAFGNFLNILKDVVKQILIQLASAIASAAILAALFTVIFPGSAGGFGSAFKTILGGGGLGSLIPGLAQGGIVPSGYPNDTYLARLSSGEAVIPLNRLNSMLDMGGGQMVADTVIRGEDIVLSYNRASKTLGR